MISSTTHWVDSISSLEVLPNVNMTKWLTKPFVLTQSLKKISEDFKVTLLNQSFHAPLIQECLAFDSPLDPETPTFIRQVVLSDGDKPLSYGRVVIPKKTYDFLSCDLAGMGEQPFGEFVLYTRSDYERSSFDYIHMKSFKSYPYLVEYLDNDFQYSQTWGRRSIFSLSGHPLLVIEVFMPNMPHYPNEG